MTQEKPLLYTIGHSDHSVEEFVGLLARYQITTVIDVRSQPYSRWVPQFDKQALAEELAQQGLEYLFMGDTLGGRPEDPTLYDPSDSHGRPNYDRLAETRSFAEGILQLEKKARRSTVCIMCSEGDYKQCHRSLLITPRLLGDGFRVLHIRPDGETVEAHPPWRQSLLF